MIDDPLTQLLMNITGMDGGWTIATQYNVAPTQQIPVLRRDGEDWQLDAMRWWLVPRWSDGPSTKYSMFNAKSETLGKSRAYAEPFKRQRCIIPVSGYYEWKKEHGAKVPYYIEPADDPGFAFAGLWDSWRSEEQVVNSCTIITAASPPSMMSIHHRIPVHLTSTEVSAWLDPDASAATLNQLLAPTIRTDIQVTPVSTYVNNARNKDPRCVEPLGETILIKH